MPDTRRSLSSLQTLLADNTSGDISAQDGRDVLVSNHPENAVQTAAFASEPSSGQLTGDLFLPSDSFYLERYSGSVWAPWGPIFPFTKPVSGDFAWINQGSAAVSTTNGGICLSAPSNGTANSLRIRKKTAPSPPYTITAALLLSSSYTAFFSGGLIFRQSSDGKVQFFGLTISTSARIDNYKYSSATAFAASYGTSDESIPFGQGPVAWLRIADDNSNRILSLSADGINFYTFASVGRTDYLTADEVGFAVDPYSDAGCMNLLSWKEG